MSNQIKEESAGVIQGSNSSYLEIDDEQMAKVKKKYSKIETETIQHAVD